LYTCEIFLVAEFWNSLSDAVVKSTSVASL